MAYIFLYGTGSVQNEKEDVPDNAAVFLARGISFADRGDYDTAIENFDNALRFAPDFAAAYYQRGDSYWKKGDYDQAIADCTQAISLDPNYAYGAKESLENARKAQGD